MSPIVGLTDSTPSFKELGRLRLGIPKAEAEKSGPREISYFRADFRPDAADSYAVFMDVYGDQPTRINIRLPFTQIDRCWDAYYEVYNTSGMLGKSDGIKWLYLRDNRTGELLVKDGIPTHADGLPVDDRGMAYLPFDKKLPVYSYKSRKGEDVAVFARPTGRLNVLVPELKRAAYVQVITNSVYNVSRISAQLAAIEAVARNIGISLPMVPMVLSRRKESISVTIKGRKSMQEHYLLNIEIDPSWMDAHFKYLDTMLPGVPILPPQLSLPAEISDEDVTEYQETEQPATEPEYDEPFFSQHDSDPAPQPAEEPISPPAESVPATETLDTPMTYAHAAMVKDSKGHLYSEVDTEKLSYIYNSIIATLKKTDLTQEHRDELAFKRDAILTIFAFRNSQP